MDVLHHPLSVVGRRHAQVGLHLFIPGPGQVGHPEVAPDQGPLQLEAQQDVQIVGNFIGLGADQVRPHLIDRQVKGLQGDVA